MEDIGIKDQVQDFFPWKKYAKYPTETAFSYSWPTTNPFQEDSVLPCLHDIAQELTVEYWFQKNEVASHPNAEQYFQPRAGLARFMSVAEGDDSKKSFKRLHRWRYSPTACYGNNEVHLHPYKARRISVAESMAIQSLPKEFSFPASMTLTDSFKAIGNGVPYVMASALAKTILDFLGGSID
jgi:DNA (cytosine-5)-methyltransferase 1